MEKLKPPRLPFFGQVGHDYFRLGKPSGPFVRDCPACIRRGENNRTGYLCEPATERQLINDQLYLWRRSDEFWQSCGYPHAPQTKEDWESVGEKPPFCQLDDEPTWMIHERARREK
jgi:hypothetical protein